MQIDVVSDTVCPWCFVGKRRLERAMAIRSELNFDVRWHPFQLNPDVPMEGVDRETYYREKFGDGSRIKAMVDQLKRVGDELEIAFDFEAIKIQPNTQLSHCLISVAQGPAQSTVKEGILSAFFEQGRDIGSADVLLQVAAEVGIDANLAAAAMEDPALGKAVSTGSEQARNMGINGVPTFVFEQTSGFSGAQGEAAFLEAFDEFEST